MLYRIIALVDKPRIYAEPIKEVHAAADKDPRKVFYTDRKNRIFPADVSEIVENPGNIEKLFPTIPDSFVKIDNPYYTEYKNSLLSTVYTIRDFARLAPVYKA